MTAQVSLFDAPATDLSHLSIEERFTLFHETHPEVYDRLVAWARQWVDAGHSKVGIGMLWEKLRWETGIGDPAGVYRLNNDFRSHMARLIMDREPDLVDVFETRALRHTYRGPS